MKKILLKTLIVCILVLLLPFVLTLLLAKGKDDPSVEAMDFSIYYEVNGARDKLSLDDYLIGVIAANIPASYELETIKAQAVIARTYALYNASLLTEDDPGKTSYTTSELGLSYIDLASLQQLWGTEDYHSYFSKLENAVYATKNEVLEYQNKLILPVFFDTGTGYTRSALQAWGADIPYLVSVPSKKDVTSTNYLHIKEYEVADLIQTLSKYYPDFNVTKDDFFKEVKVTSRDSADYVLKMDLGNQTVSGEEFAKVLGLSSSHFYIENYEGKVRIICNGTGHGVGLSQYGANAMAEDGSNYTDILKYYYSGILIADLSE